MNLREFRGILETGLSDVNIGMIPPAMDQVLFGNLRRTRPGDIKVMFFIGMNEGLVPLPTRTDSLITENERNHARYPFYFENLSQLMTEFPSLRHENDTFARDIYEYYAWAFGELAKEGWLGSDARAGGAQSLAYTMVALQAGWVQASSPFKNELLPSLPLSKALATLLRLHVSQKHLDEYDAIWIQRGIEL